MSDSGKKKDQTPSNELATDVKTTAAPKLFGSRAMAAGSGKRLKDVSISPFNQATSPAAFHADSSLKTSNKYLVVGDTLHAPFTALCLRAHGLECDLCHHQSINPVDWGTIVLTPSVTQVMGDTFNVNVPSGSVIGRVLVFDHVGNDMCDLDLNDFREEGQAPTFFACDRPKIEAALLSLCRIGPHSCTVYNNVTADVCEALDNGGVRVKFDNGTSADYAGIIATSRNQKLVPELTVNNDELQRLHENQMAVKESQGASPRWLEVCVPPLPELGKNEKRFTPGSQEIVELITPREAKMTVRPTMMATKLFYNAVITIPDGAPNPALKSTSMKQFWDDVVEHWTAGVPGYVSHTMFRPMINHMREHLRRQSVLTYNTPHYLLDHWIEGEGRVIKIGPAVHSTQMDAIDVSDAMSFMDSWQLAQCLSDGGSVYEFEKTRKLQVQEEMDYHANLATYGLKERGQFGYAVSRFRMKLMKHYKKCWKQILKNYVTMPRKALLPK